MLEYALAVGFVLHVESDVSNHSFRIGRDNVHGSQIGSCLRQDGSHLGEHARFICQGKSNGQTIIGIGADVVGGHRSGEVVWSIWISLSQGDCREVPAVCLRE